MTLPRIATVLVLTITTAAFAGGFEIARHTIDGGGGTSRGGGFTLSGTIGQPDAGTHSGGGFELSGGFWVGGGATLPPCPADTNDDRTVDVADLITVLADWGSCASPCDGDVNDDGLVDVADVLLVLTAWGTCPS